MAARSPAPIRSAVAWILLPLSLQMLCSVCGYVLGPGDIGGFDGPRRWCRRCADATDLARAA